MECIMGVACLKFCGENFRSHPQKFPATIGRVLNAKFFLRVFTQDAIELQDKEYAMNNVTCDHTPFARVLACDPKHAHVIDIARARSTCMHVRTGVGC